MLPFILLEDSNTFSGLIFNTVVEFTGGDWIFLGIILLAVLAGIFAFSGVRSGGVVAVSACFIFIASLFYPGFIFLFWLAFIVAVFMLVNAIRKKLQGQ